MSVSVIDRTHTDSKRLRIAGLHLLTRISLTASMLLIVAVTVSSVHA